MDDLISRQAAIDVLRTCQTYLFDTHDKDKKISLEDAEYEIEQLSSAQPERKEGKWIPVVNGRGGHECNQCHEYAPSYKTGEEHLSDFCPECGAKMKGDK